MPFKDLLRNQLNPTSVIAINELIYLVKAEIASKIANLTPDETLGST